MNPNRCYLVTVLNGQDPKTASGTLRCALKVPRDLDEEFYMEPDARERIHALLPLHVKNAGPVVDIEEIFEVKDMT